MRKLNSVCTVKSHFIVAWLNGESRHVKIEKLILTLATVAKKRVHLYCMVSLLVPLLSKKEITLNIKLVTKFPLFYLFLFVFYFINSRLYGIQIGIGFIADI